MRKTIPLLLSILVIGCATARTPAISSQAQSNRCAWPDSLDAVVAAPGNHRVLFENDQVRVLDVTVAPGEREPLHAHCLPSVLYVMSEGVYRDYDASGNVVEDQNVAPPASAFPITLWMGPQAPHAVENLDTTPVRLLRVELKK